MENKEAIEKIKIWYQTYLANSTSIFNDDKAICEIINLLQQGKKFEFIFSDMHYTIQHMLDKIYLYNIKTPEMTDAEYIEKAFEIIEEKYFPEINS